MKTVRYMPCADEGMARRTFRLNKDGGYACTYCGFTQASSPEGAAYLCALATWHDLDAYNNYARIARSAGFAVPDEPASFEPRTDGRRGAWPRHPQPKELA